VDLTAVRSGNNYHFGTSGGVLPPNISDLCILYPNWEILQSFISKLTSASNTAFKKLTKS